MLRVALTTAAFIGASIGALLPAHSQAFLEPLFENGDWNVDISGEFRQFEATGEFGQDSRGYTARLNAEYFTEWNDGQDFFKFNPYIRVDGVDKERTGFDLREAFWGHLGDSWEMKLGFTRVFWGRTEFLNVVDVVNQQDFVDGARKAKLGQPLLHLSLVRDEAILDFYTLIGVRERTYPGEDGRLRTPIPVDASGARYDQGTSKNDIGFAARWSQPAGDISEFAVSVFSGVSREPYFAFNFDLEKPRLVPVYYHMDQIGLEWEIIYDGWVGKLEAAGVRSQRENYFTAVMGVEYTFGDVFESGIDLTTIVEYMWDERQDDTPAFLEKDLGFGLRATFNDEQSTTFLLGALIDPETDEKVLAFEGSRRIGDAFKLSAQLSYVLDRGQPPLSRSSLAALDVLSRTGQLGQSVDILFVANLMSDIIRRYGLEQSFFNPTFALDTLQQLERLTYADRKVSILESDSYLQVELTYYF